MSANRSSRGAGARKIYQVLRQRILSMVLMPGHPLDELGVAAEFGVSRSPVREALFQLSAEGLTVSLPNKSTIVSPLNVEQFPQYVDALDLMQRAVSYLAAIHRTDEDLEIINDRQQDFVDSVGAGDVVAMIECNRDFHMAISLAAHNAYLSSSYGKLLDEGRRYLRLYFKSYGDTMPSDFPDEHGMIIDAIIAQNAELSEKLAHQHTMEFHSRFIDYMNTRYTDQISVALPASVKPAGENSDSSGSGDVRGSVSSK